MANLNEYKCPCCNGAIAFDPNAQKMKCPYCGTEFELETLKNMDDALNGDKAHTDNLEWNVSEGQQWNESERSGIHSYVCQSCGGEIIGDETLSATKCPYCGNPVVVMDNFAGVLKPDYLIPFKVDKETAKKGLMKHLKGKKLLPSIFSSENHIDEIKGIYVPFWVFNADAKAHIRYKGTKTRAWSDSDYNYTETSYYSVLREGSLSFKDIPADGSSKMPDDLMESIEPFDFSKAMDFQTAYLAGFLADKYDVTAEENIERVNARAKNSTDAAFRRTVEGYTTLTTEANAVELKNGKAKYALCPVWILNTTWKGKKYTFAMNGQTGKFVGNLPMDKGKFWKYLLMYSGIFAAAIYAVIWILKLI